MTDEQLRRNLRLVDAPVRADSAFVDDLHAVLAHELGLAPSPRTRAGSDPRSAAGRGDGVGSAGWPSPPRAAGDRRTRAGAHRTRPGRADSAVESGAVGGAHGFPFTDSIATCGADRVADPVVGCGPRRRPDRFRTCRPYRTSAAACASARPDERGTPPGPARAATAATWNPDGSRIAFVMHDLTELRPRSLIWETDADGSEPRLLSEGCDLPTCVEENDPGYSPDGTRIAFVRRELPMATQPRYR